MVNGILSAHEANVIVNLTDAGCDKPLSRVSDLFLQNFREDSSRIRAIYALRTLLSIEWSSQPSASSLPTSPETIAMLFLLHVAANDTTSGKTISAESKEFAAAALYEHLLRVEDLLRDDSLLFEQRKYKATAAVGGNKGKGGGARDAIEKDAFRGHLLQKVFILHCALLTSSNQPPADQLVCDLTKNANAICSPTTTQTTLETLETTVSSWGSDATIKQQVSDALAGLKKSYDRELLNNSSSSVIQGAPQGNNLMAGGFLHRAVPMPQFENASSVAHTKKGTKHFLTAGDLAVAFASSSSCISNNSISSTTGDKNDDSSNGTAIVPQTAVLTPASVVVPPPRGRIAADARLLLPSSNPLLFDAVPHPQDWKEGRSIIDSAVSGAELSAQQLTKLTQLLENGGDSGKNGNSNSKNGASNTAAKKGGKGGKNDNNSAPSDAFPYLGLTPVAFGKIARSNPKAATVILSRFSENTSNKQVAEPYIQQLIEFNHANNPDYCPTVVLAASKAGLVSPAQLSQYVSRAKAYSMSCINAKEKSDFLKGFFTSLHQICEKTPLDAGDKNVVSALLNNNNTSELADVVKMWN